MSREFRITDELTAVESALTGLKPKASGIDRDRLLFLAGQAAGQSGPAVTAALPRALRWFWPAATMVSLSASVVFGVLTFHRQAAADPVIRYVYVEIEKPGAQKPQPVPVIAQTTAAVPEVRDTDVSSQQWRVESAMLRSRHQVLITDIERLPMPSASGAGARRTALTMQDARNSFFPGEKLEHKPSTGYGLLKWSWPSL